MQRITFVLLAVVVTVVMASSGSSRADVPGGRFGGSTYGSRMPPAGDRASDLAHCFEQSVHDKIGEGYFVKNDGFWRGFKHSIQDRTWWANTEKGGRCGEYGGRGMQWIRPCVVSLFGSTAVIDDIIIEEKSSVRGRDRNSDWSSALSPDQMFESNHRATRVILPDGRRFVVDFWDGISSGNPRMVPEREWAAKWKKAVGDQTIGVDAGVVMLSEDQQNLKRLIQARGEQAGIEVFRKTFNPKTVGDGKYRGDPELWIRSWNLDPW
jgi:hypothetical protein